MSDPGAKLAEQKIIEAQKAGEFENLPGAGKPLDLEEPPAGVSRDAWMLMRVLKEANVVPEEVEDLHKLHALKLKLQQATTDAERTRLSEEIARKDSETRMKIEAFARRWK